MNMLEKSMLFVPNRFFADGHEMYVSFNIAGIPRDMSVTAMTIMIPLPEHTSGMLHLHEITQGWDEQLIQTVRPAHSLSMSAIPTPADLGEGSCVLTHLAHSWRFRSLENHGVHIILESPDAAPFSVSHMPYILISTL